MNEVNEILKEKFGISTEGKSLEQVLKEMSDKWKTLNEDSKEELKDLILSYSISDDIIYAEWDNKNTKKEDVINMIEETTKMVKEILANDDGIRYTTEDVIRMREEKKLTKEFKAKDWI